MKKLKISILILLVLALTTTFAACSAKYSDSGSGPPISYPSYYSGSEEYRHITEMPFVSADTNPKSSFGLDVNTASYSILRSAILEGVREITPDMVRIEEMVNYFSYNYPSPEQSLSLGGSIFACPWNKDTNLMTFNVKAEEIELGERMNNIVFLLDVSGSMTERLHLMQQSLKLAVEDLDKGDRISIITYASSDKVILNGATGEEKEAIVKAIDSLSAGGSTAGSEGIKTAYEIAENHFIANGNNSIILVTDGDFNVGINNTKDLKKFVKDKNDKKNIHLSVFGMGYGNTKDNVMEALAEAGQGSYHYIGNLTEAKKALVKGLGGILNIVAKDAKIQVEFNPQLVEGYRLIGYENNIITKDQFEDAKTDTGEIGSGHCVTAVFEVKLKNSETGDIASCKLRYKDAFYDDVEKEISYKLSTYNYSNTPNEDLQFISAVVEFGLILRDSEYKADSNLNSIIMRLEALDCVKTNDFKAEFLNLVKSYIK